MDKRKIVYVLDSLKEEYLKLDTLQKIYDKKTDKELEEYKLKNNLDSKYFTTNKEWNKNNWYIQINKRKKEIIILVIKKLEELLEIKIKEHQHIRIFMDWLKMPFLKQ